MAQASAIAAWLLLFFKVAMSLMALSITMLCLVWVIRSRQLSKKKDTERGQ